MGDTSIEWSGRVDLNHRSPGPESDSSICWARCQMLCRKCVVMFRLPSTCCLVLFRDVSGCSVSHNFAYGPPASARLVPILLDWHGSLSLPPPRSVTARFAHSFTDPIAIRVGRRRGRGADKFARRGRADGCQGTCWGWRSAGTRSSGEAANTVRATNRR